MFLASRRKIREVEVEVLSPGGTGVVAPIASKYPDPWAKKRRESNGHSAAPTTALPWSKLFEVAEAERPAEPRNVVEASEPLEAVEVPEPIDIVEVSEPLVSVQSAEAPDLIEVLEPAFADGEEAALEPESEATELICEIVFWRGYRKAAFYARIFDEAGEALAVAESPFFRFSGNGIPDATAESESAYEDLVERLEHDGWESLDHGSTWYGDFFRRDITVAVAPEPE